jgi:hypothetical protein
MVFAATAKAQDEEVVQVLVGPCSYEVSEGFTRSELIEHHAVREALLLTLRRTGFSVSNPTALPPSRVELTYTPLAQLWSRLGGAPPVTVEVLVSEGGVRLVVHDGDRSPYEVRVSKDAEGEAPGGWPVSDDQLWTPVRRIVTRLARSHDLTVWEPSFEGELQTDVFGETDRLDAGFADRLLYLNRLLNGFEEGVEDIALPAVLATISALHGAYHAMTDELSAVRYFGKARAFASIFERVTREHPDRGTAEVILRDLDYLIRRFGHYEDVGVLEGAPPLLAEAERLQKLLSLEFREIDRCPEPETLFEFLLLRVHNFFPRGSVAARWGYVRSNPSIDSALVFAKKEKEFDTWFDAAQFLHEAIDASDCLRELFALAETFGFEEAFEEARLAAVTRSENNPWSILDNVGAQAKSAGDSPGDNDILMLLGYLDAFEQVVRGDPRIYGQTMTYVAGSMLEEIMARYQAVAWYRRERLENIGNRTRTRQIDEVFDRYGRERLLAPRFLPDVAAPERVATLSRKQRVELGDQAEALFAKGGYKEALAVHREHLHRLETADSFLFEGAGRDVLFESELFELFARAGQIDEGIQVLAALRPSGFSGDSFRQTVLLHHRDEFPELPEPFAMYGGTGSATDLMTTQEYAFRIGNYEAMLRVAAQYDYGPQKSILCREAIARLVLDQGDRDSAWNTFRNQLRRICSDQPNAVRYLHHWVALLDPRLGTDPRWGPFKKELRLEAWASVCEHTVILRGKPAPAEVDAAVGDLLAIARAESERPRIEGKSNPLLWTALQLAHDAVARKVLRETQGLVKPPSKALSGEVYDLMRDTNALTAVMENASPKFKWMEAQLFHMLVRLGAKPSRVASFAATLEGLPRYLHGPNMNPVLGATIPSPEAFTVYLEAFAEEHAGDLFVGKHFDPEIDRPAIFEAAFSAGAYDVALAAALEHAYRDESLDLMLQLFVSEEVGRAWVAANAKTPKVEKRWLEELEGREDDAWAMARKRNSWKPLPSPLPGLLDHLNPTAKSGE